MSAALVAVAVARRWWPLHASDPRPPWLAAATPIVVPYALSLLGWFAFFYAYWGTPLPQGPYGSMSQTELANIMFGVPGLFFDQEYGLLAYAPAYVLAGFGLWTMVRRPGPLRRVGLEVGLLFAALALTVGAFRIWWGGSAAPGRPLMSGLLLLMLPMAVQIGSARGGIAAAGGAAPARLDRHRHRAAAGVRRGRAADRQPPRRHVGAARLAVAAMAAVVGGADLHRPRGRASAGRQPGVDRRRRARLVAARPPSGAHAGPGVADGAGRGRGRGADRAGRVDAAASAAAAAADRRSCAPVRGSPRSIRSTTRCAPSPCATPRCGSRTRAPSSRRWPSR